MDLRVLVVEDEMVILLLIEDMLAELGCTNIVSAKSTVTALPLIGANVFDVAILDVNLNGETSYEIADLLSRSNIPFVFSSGYSDHVNPVYHGQILLEKPYSLVRLSEALTMALA